jgi:hypothetical protein
MVQEVVAALVLRAQVPQTARTVALEQMRGWISFGLNKRLET